MTGTRDDLLPPRAQRADGATLACVYLIALTVIPSHLVFVGIAVTPADLLGVGFGLVYVCAHLTNTLGMAKGRNLVRSVVVLYAVSVLFGYGHASRGVLDAEELKNMDHKLILLAAALAITLVVCDGVRGPKRLDTVLKAAVVTCTFVAFVATLQSRFGIDYTQLFSSLPGLQYSMDGLGRVLDRNGMARPAGTTGTPIELGVLCAMTLPLAVHYALRSSQERDRPWFWWGCTALIFATVFFSLSRSAVLGLAAGGGLMLLGMPARRRLWTLFGAAAAMVVLKILVPGMFGTILGLFTNASTDDSVAWRTHDYPIAAEQIAKHPWLGRGLGTWFPPKHEVFDNQVLLTLVEEGIVGLVAFAALLFVGIGAAGRAWYVANDMQTRDLALCVAAGLTVPVIGSITFDLVSFDTVTGFTFVLLGAGGALLRNIAAESAPAGPVSRRSPPRPASPGPTVDAGHY